MGLSSFNQGYLSGNGSSLLSTCYGDHNTYHINVFTTGFCLYFITRGGVFEVDFNNLASASAAIYKMCDGVVFKGLTASISGTYHPASATVLNAYTEFVIKFSNTVSGVWEAVLGGNAMPNNIVGYWA